MMNLKVFAEEIEALVQKHGGLLTEPVSASIEGPTQHTQQIGAVKYTDQIERIKINFNLEIQHISEFKEYSSQGN